MEKVSEQLCPAWPNETYINYIFSTQVLMAQAVIDLVI